MKLMRVCFAILITLTFASVAAAQCGPARPKTPTGVGSLDQMIIAQEQMIIDAIKKNDVEAFKSLVDVTGTVVDRYGIQKIEVTIPSLFGGKLKFSEFTLENPRVKSVDKNTAIIHYESSVTTTMDGKTNTGKSFETTIFVRRGAKWVAWFHQSSDIAPAETSAGGK